MHDVVVILEKDKLSHPLLYNCNILVPCAAINYQNINTSFCTKGVERKLRIWTQRRLGKEVLAHAEIAKRLEESGVLSTRATKKLIKKL